MQTKRDTGIDKEKSAITILSVFDCDSSLRFGILTILQALAVSFFLVLGVACVSWALSNSAMTMSERAHEERFVESHQKQTDATAIGKEIKEIRVEFAPGGEEKVFFLINGFYPPKYFALEGDRPRISCDFYGARLGKGIGRCIKVNGRLIQQIRTAIHEGKNPKVRIVLDLVPGKNYEVEQVFYKKENLYTIIVKEERADH